jgi:hypothetical protein
VAFLIEEGEMDGRAFDTLTRRAADVVSRRSSLAALGGATLAAGLLAPLAAEAKDNKAKKAKKKAKKKCKKQEGQCNEAVQAFCSSLNNNLVETVGDEGFPFNECVQRFSFCCPFFSSCNAREGVECLLSRFLVKV